MKLCAMQVGMMNKLLQNVNLAGTSLFLQILGVSAIDLLPAPRVLKVPMIDD